MGILDIAGTVAQMRCCGAGLGFARGWDVVGLVGHGQQGRVVGVECVCGGARVAGSGALERGAHNVVVGRSVSE